VHEAAAAAPSFAASFAASSSGTTDAQCGLGGLALMNDIVILALTVAMFAATVGFVRLCERM
jgi:hypothetical protein